MDIDRFAKEWTEMFDELTAGAEDPEDRLSKLEASIRLRHTSQADSPATAAAGKGTPRQVQSGPSGSSASVSTETVHFDLTPASLTRWQHRDKSLAKDIPEDRPVRVPNLFLLDGC